MSVEYDLIKRAMIEGKQVVLTYKGYRREVCPHVLGHKNGHEKVLTFQFGGGSSSGLPPGGEWRCMFLWEVSDVKLQDGPWHTDTNHSQTQTCVDQVDLEVWVSGGLPYIKRA